jgi:hypothetical protein
MPQQQQQHRHPPLPPVLLLLLRPLLHRQFPLFTPTLLPSVNRWNMFITLIQQPACFLITPSQLLISRHLTQSIFCL